MTKKRGFTLVEIIVVLAVSSIMLSAIAGMIIFLTQSSTNLIDKSQELTDAQTAAMYLRGLVENGKVKDIDEMKSLIFNDPNAQNVNDIKDKTLKNLGLTELYFFTKMVDTTDPANDSYFIYCKMECENGEHFEINLGVITP